MTVSISGMELLKSNARDSEYEASSPVVQTNSMRLMMNALKEVAATST